MTKQDNTLARLDEIVARLDALGIVAPPSGTPASVNPDGSPGHVAPGELIESAWGNAVSDSVQALSNYDDLQDTYILDHGTKIADLIARKPKRWVLFNSASTTCSDVSGWTDFVVGGFTLPGPYIWDILVTVSAELRDGDDNGACKLIGGINGTQRPDSMGTSAVAAGGSNWLTASFAHQLGAGTFNVSAFGQTATGGYMGSGTATVIAFPNG